MQVFHGGLLLIGVAAFEVFLGVHQGGLDLGLHVSGEFIAAFLEGLFEPVDTAVELVAGLDALLALLVLVSMELGVLGHLLDLFLGQTGGTLNGDLLLFTGAEVLGGHVKDAVGVDVEGDLDLRGAAGGRRDAVELEGTEVFVVAGHGTLALKDNDFHAGLVVRVG